MSLPVATVDLHIIVTVISRFKRKVKKVMVSEGLCYKKKYVVFHLIISLVERSLNIRIPLALSFFHHPTIIWGNCTVNTTFTDKKPKPTTDKAIKKISVTL